MSTLSSYGSMDVNQVRIHAEPTQDNHAATRLYVDTAAATVRDGILGGAGPALDTLKEIEVFLQGDGTNVSASLVNQLSSVQSQLNAEISRASGAEGALHSDLEAEKGIRSLAVQALTTAFENERTDRAAKLVAQTDVNTYLENRVETLSGQHIYTNGRIDTESARATAAEQTLAQNLAQSAVEASAYVDAGLSLKLDKSGGAVSGDLAVSGLVSIGPAWRIVAVGASLEFQYSPDGGESWSTGIPFISV